MDRRDLIIVAESIKIARNGCVKDKPFHDGFIEQFINALAKLCPTMNKEKFIKIAEKKCKTTQY